MYYPVNYLTNGIKMKETLLKKDYSTPQLNEIGKIPTMTQSVQSSSGDDNATSGHMHS